MDSEIWKLRRSIPHFSQNEEKKKIFLQAEWNFTDKFWHIFELMMAKINIYPKLPNNCPPPPRENQEMFFHKGGNYLGLFFPPVPPPNDFIDLSPPQAKNFFGNIGKNTESNGPPVKICPPNVLSPPPAPPPEKKSPTIIRQFRVISFCKICIACKKILLFLLILWKRRHDFLSYRYVFFSKFFEYHSTIE